MCRPRAPSQGSPGRRWRAWARRLGRGCPPGSGGTRGTPTAPARGEGDHRAPGGSGPGGSSAEQRWRDQTIRRPPEPDWPDPDLLPLSGAAERRSRVAFHTRRRSHRHPLAPIPLQRATFRSVLMSLAHPGGPRPGGGRVSGCLWVLVPVAAPRRVHPESLRGCTLHWRMAAGAGTAAARGRPGDVLGGGPTRRCRQRPLSAPPKASSQLPRTPSPPGGGTWLAAPHTQPFLPPGSEAASGRLCRPGQGSLPAKLQQIPGRSGAREEKQPLMGGRWAAGGLSAGPAGAGLLPSPPGTPHRVQTPQGACSGRIRPWDHPPQNWGAPAGLSLTPRPDPHPQR